MEGGMRSKRSIEGRRAACWEGPCAGFESVKRNKPGTDPVGAFSTSLFCSIYLQSISSGTESAGNDLSDTHKLWPMPQKVVWGNKT